MTVVTLKAQRIFLCAVRESNRGTMVWFVPDLAALEDRLAGGKNG